ncbi:MAG: HEAT repeat domain-containing protein [Caldilineaceae bacterium]|nr:HEAT repeat domain-containing protein [Caldilineaceae bacterium]MBP8107432.1 HEAT repeat domain-containing protein [Caldilineaceae bacterium]MBP8123367.1 HEAT repeat domain-containing protein [Caldilineaceae bacterium]MBP9070975.1 HEAT repeat domain-containing protein [Caldilineaceae bacterium]
MKVTQISQQDLHDRRMKAEAPSPLSSLSQELEYAALTAGHSRKLAPQEFIEICEASFPSAGKIQNEQWLLLRNSTFPYSTIIPEEQSAVKDIQESIWKLVEAGDFVVTIYLVLKLRKKSVEDDKGDGPTPGIQLVVINNLEEFKINAKGDVAFDGGIIVKGNSRVFLGSAENVGGMIARPEEIELSAQFERPNSAYYKTAYAVPQQVPKQLVLFSSQLPYVHPDATPLIVENLAHADTPIDTARIAHLLGMLGPTASPAVEAISAQLESSDNPEDLQSTFVDVLGDIGSNEAVESLLKRANLEQSHRVQKLILLALLRIHSTQAIRGVFEHLACFKPDTVVFDLVAQHASEDLVALFLRRTGSCPGSSSPYHVATFLSRLDPPKYSRVLLDQLQVRGDDAFRIFILATIRALGKEYWSLDTARTFLSYLEGLQDDTNQVVSACATQCISELIPSSQTIGSLSAPDLRNSNGPHKSEVGPDFRRTEMDHVDNVRQKSSGGAESKLEQPMKIRAGGDVVGPGAQQAKNGGVIVIGGNNSVNTQYKPKPWERIIALIAALAWVGLIGFLVVRNEPLDPNLTVFVRIILSVMAGILGAVIPGFLSVDIKKSGLAIRAGGALALFVISYFFTPTVIV